MGENFHGRRMRVSSRILPRVFPNHSKHVNLDWDREAQTVEAKVQSPLNLGWSLGGGPGAGDRTACTAFRWLATIGMKLGAGHDPLPPPQEVVT